MVRSGSGADLGPAARPSTLLELDRASLRIEEGVNVSGEDAQAALAITQGAG